MWLFPTTFFCKRSSFVKKRPSHRRFCGDLGVAKMERVVQRREFTEPAAAASKGRHLSVPIWGSCNRTAKG